MRKTFIIITALIGLISCEKDKEAKMDNSVVYDTIIPLNYFPAFPGSYWIYDSNDTLKVANQYEEYIFNSAGFTAVPDFDTLFLPKLILNGVFNPTDTFAYVNGYSISKAKKGSHYRDPAFKGLLSLNEGSQFSIGGSFQGHKIIGKTIKVDTTISIGTVEYKNVIVTIRFDRACELGLGVTPEECAYLREYYAKDVGLIKREVRSSITNTDFVKDIELVKYEIIK